MRLLLTFTTAFLFAALFSILPRNITIKESKELNYTLVPLVASLAYDSPVFPIQSYHMFRIGSLFLDLDLGGCRSHLLELVKRDRLVVWYGF
jgi:hypothetical protein